MVPGTVRACVPWKQTSSNLQLMTETLICASGHKATNYGTQTHALLAFVTRSVCINISAHLPCAISTVLFFLGRAAGSSAWSNTTRSDTCQTPGGGMSLVRHRYVIVMSSLCLGSYHKSSSLHMSGIDAIGTEWAEAQKRKNGVRC